MPHVEIIDGVDMWVIEGNTFGQCRLRAAPSTSRATSTRSPTRMGGSWGIDDGHRRRVGPEGPARLMDEFGIHIAGVYPNSIGLGGQNLVNAVATPPCSACASQLYNDAMARCRRSPNNRLIPMPIMPAWRHRRAASARPSAAPTWDAAAST